MAIKKLNFEEMQTFLNRADPALVGVVGTLGEGGYPHLVPVWYRYDGERIHIWTLESRTWVQNLVRDNRAAFSVHEHELTSLGVSIKGRAEITTNEGQWVTGEIWRITRRYITDEAEVGPYINKWLHLRTIVSVTPEKISAWRDG
ncbi:MAG: pyridoxamine 5'-phosphate oxidase family protein [Anaerolineales bacterium]